MQLRRLAVSCGSSLVGLLVAVSSVAAQNPKPPEVLVMATGGTIASTGNYYGDRGGAVNKISVDELTKAAPGIEKVATMSAEQFSNVASGAIGPKQWLDLSKRINAAFHDRPALSGVVVTHGTDTMEETAYF